MTSNAKRSSVPHICSTSTSGSQTYSNLALGPLVFLFKDFGFHIWYNGEFGIFENKNHWKWDTENFKNPQRNFAEHSWQVRKLSAAIFRGGKCFKCSTPIGSPVNKKKRKTEFIKKNSKFQKGQTQFCEDHWEEHSGYGCWKLHFKKSGHMA